MTPCLITFFRLLCIFIPATISRLCVVIGVMRPSWFTEILISIGILLSKEIHQHKIVIILYLICVVISLSAVYATVFPKGSVTGCDNSFGGG